MPFTSITTIVTDLTNDQVAIDAAISLARRSDGHVDIICLGIDHNQASYYYAAANAIALQASLEAADQHAKELEDSLSESLKNSAVSYGLHRFSTPMPGLSQFLAHNTRFADVVVLSRPYGPAKSHVNVAILESALFDAGVPTLVIPEGRDFDVALDKVVIAWNESHEALAAVRTAIPLLKTAGHVNISIVDPPSHSPDRSDPGGALSLMLSRHGIHAEVSILAKTMPRISDVIARQVTDLGADILVMGAYGHSRFRESILGGATRNTLQLTEVPVLMAH